MLVSAAALRSAHGVGEGSSYTPAVVPAGNRSGASLPSAWVGLRDAEDCCEAGRPAPADRVLGMDGWLEHLRDDDLALLGRVTGRRVGPGQVEALLADPA